MALSLKVSALSNLPYDKYCRNHESLLVIRSQSCRDEGRSRHIVDANMHILERRIEEARAKERLETCYIRGRQGWNYTEREYENRKREPQQVCLSIKLVAVVARTFGLTILTGTLGLCVAAIFVHMKF